MTLSAVPVASPASVACITAVSYTHLDVYKRQLFSPERVYELIRYFILFDANVKKVCRYQQFFAVQEIMKTIAESDEHGNCQSGVIWHTQGSGKSLTMVMLAKTILMELKDCHPRVVIVTDRKELDLSLIHILLYCHQRKGF